MRRDPWGPGWFSLVVRNIRRSPWRSLAGVATAAVAAAAFLGASALLLGADRTLKAELDRLGADLVVIPPAHRQAVEAWLGRGDAPPVPAQVPVAEWQRRLEAGQVVGVRQTEPWDLTAGGRGAPTAAPAASALLLRLERWAEPMVTVATIRDALPDAAVVVGEQAARRVARDMQPVVRFLTVSAGVAWLASLLIAGLLTALQAAERRGELGMMRAMGASRRYLLTALLAESAALALAGAVVGAGLALGGLTLLPAGALLRLSGAELAGIGGVTVGAAVVTALAAATGPALRAVWMDPLEALRQGR